jgi:type I restriction enzyme S subunit
VNVKPDAIDWTDTVYWDAEAAPIPGEFYLESGDLVFGMDRPFVGDGVRVAAISSEDLPALLLQRVMRIRPDDENERSYVRYVMSTDVLFRYLEPLFTGVSVPHVSEWQVRKFKMPLPPVYEQRRIVAHLDEQTARIDTLIEEQQGLIELLRERRAAVLSATFNTGPSTETTKVGRLLAARPSYGVLVPKYVDESEGVPFVRVGDLLNLAPERPMLAIAPEQSDEYSRTKIVGGEVLLGVVGKMGQAALAPRWLAGANVARAVAVLRCKDPAVAPLLCAWLGSITFLCQAELATSGDSIQPTLGMKDLARFDINLPINPDAAVNLAGQLAKIDALIAETGRFIELSKERRSALITAAVTGQIDVREMV